MDDIRNGKVKAAFFLFFIVLLIVGGYIGTVLFTKEDNKNRDTSKVVSENDNSKDLRILKTKDYIYFENSVTKSAERDIIYQDVVFNFDNNEARNIEKLLNDERIANEETYKAIKDMDLSSEEASTILVKDTDVYAATYNKYNTYFNKEYVSLVNNTMEYNCHNGLKNKNISSYVFSLEKEKFLTKEELMEEFSITKELIKEKITTKLSTDEKLLEKLVGIEVDLTLESIENNEYGLYVNKNGYLVISYLVKTSENNYNDIIILS